MSYSKLFSGQILCGIYYRKTFKRPPLSFGHYKQLTDSLQQQVREGIAPL